MIKINTHGNQFAFEAGAMRMDVVIRILGFLIKRDAAQINILPVLSQFPVSAWQAEFCKSTSRILCLLTLTIELHLIGLGFFLAQIGKETEFIVGTIAVGVVELGRNLLAVNGYYSALNVADSAQLAEIYHHRSIGSCHLGRIGNRHLEISLRLG